MRQSSISIIAVIGKNRELGKDNKLIWHIPEDMQYFKKLTMGNVVIMGRKTFESLKAPLSKRVNIIVTTKKNYKPNSNNKRGAVVLITHSIDEALKAADKVGKKIFIIGGGRLYKQMLPYVDKLYLTLVDKIASADTYFPKYSAEFRLVQSRKSSYKDLRYTFAVFEKMN